MNHITVISILIFLMMLHIIIPLAYYLFLRNTSYKQKWGLKIKRDYYPSVTIILPTYNEEKNIEKKLDNICNLIYPKDKLSLIIIDSASTDNTLAKIKKWLPICEKKINKILLLNEKQRKGMIPALNHALREMFNLSWKTDIILFTDADAFVKSNALEKLVQYFSDTKVGAVSASILPLTNKTSKEKHAEETYRGLFNVLRVGESKIHSTPIHNGSFVAYRYSLIKKIKNLPEYTGNNDSTPGSLIAFMGYRAIQINDVFVYELVSQREVLRKVRRAQHLILHFLKTKRYAKKKNLYKPSIFDKIWIIEFWLVIINPWILLVTGLLMLMFFFFGFLPLYDFVLMILSATVALLISKKIRVWIIYQLILLIAFFRTIFTKDLAWKK